MGAWVELYRTAKKAIQLWTDSVQLCEVTYIRLLLRVGRKAVDEWQISLDYVRGSNIYVRGYLDLRAWSLRLRTQIEEYHYGKALFSLRERCFFLRWIRGIRAIKSVFCTANLPTIMYFFSVISPLNKAQLSADPHTTHYNTDDFQLTPTICEATYRPNLIL